MRNQIENEYFEWLFNLACGRTRSKQISYRKLLTRLHNTIFRYSIPNDQNRAEDGINLRYRFALEHEKLYSYEMVMTTLNGPCSVLEMMIALAIHCEENIMDDPNIGDRTAQWFWGMVINLGLGSMLDDRFDKRIVDEHVARFLDRDYEPDGKGGLFTVRHCNQDLRDVEIWRQLCWYLNSIT